MLLARLGRRKPLLTYHCDLECRRSGMASS